MKKYGALFDMDGVIADTNPYHAKAFEAFFDKYGIPHSEEAFEHHMYGKHNSYIMRHFFNKDFTAEEIITLENEKEALFREIYKHEVTEVAGLRVLLEDLQQHGFDLGVATSAPKMNMDLILDALGIRQYFKSFLYSERVTAHKPDPEVYLQSTKNLGLSPADCLVFEDSFSGATAGIRAGMKVIGVLTTHKIEDLPPCAAYIHDHTEINAKQLLSFLH